ncbi:MAG TPA: methionyl-tRNA formyltransferase [Balneolaceae bacterium]
MRIVFMGSPDFAVPSLEKLHQSDHEIVTVVSNVDKRRGRRAKPTPTAVKAKALKLGLPVVEVDKMDDPSFYEQLRRLKADLFVVVAFRILPADVLELPSKGSVNLHASLLPKYRGAAPIHWSIINGEQETGCTIFWLNEKVDTGQIIKQKATEIGPNETTGDLYERLKKMGSELLANAIEEIEQNSAQTSPQQHEKATPAPKLFTDDCRLDFHQPAQKVHNKIRGLSPFPTAWAELDDLKFNIYRSEIGPEKDLSPGELSMEDGILLAGCESGTIMLKEVQMEGKRRMNSKDFINGYSGIGVLH